MAISWPQFWPHPWIGWKVAHKLGHFRRIRGNSLQKLCQNLTSHKISVGRARARKKVCHNHISALLRNHPVEFWLQVLIVQISFQTGIDHAVFLSDVLHQTPRPESVFQLRADCLDRSDNAQLSTNGIDHKRQNRLNTKSLGFLLKGFASVF